MTETVQIPAYDHAGSIPAYVARPAGTPRAAIIVIPEIFGVNPGIRQKCDKWAAKGYLAVAPDLFWRFAPGVELNPDVEAELQQAFADYRRTQFGGPEAQAAIHAGLDDHPKVTLHDYAGLDHGFAAEMGDRRDEAGAQLADSRTEAFLTQHLG